MNDSWLSTVKIAIGSWVIQVTGFYIGAVIIAFIASLVRLVYMAEDKPTSILHWLRLFIRLYIMSLGLTLLMVHVGLEYNYSHNVTIIFSSLIAFLSEEFYDFVIISKDRIFTKLSNRFLDDK